MCLDVMSFHIVVTFNCVLKIYFHLSTSNGKEYLLYIPMVSLINDSIMPLPLCILDFSPCLCNRSHWQFNKIVLLADGAGMSFFQLKTALPFFFVILPKLMVKPHKLCIYFNVGSG